MAKPTVASLSTEVEALKAQVADLTARLDKAAQVVGSLQSAPSSVRRPGRAPKPRTKAHTCQSCDFTSLVTSEYTAHVRSAHAPANTAPKATENEPTPTEEEALLPL